MMHVLLDYDHYRNGNGNDNDNDDALILALAIAHVNKKLLNDFEFGFHFAVFSCDSRALRSVLQLKLN